MFLEEVALDETLSKKVCLHGGTALNLFLFDTPRLSFDIDLNYIGSVDKEVMQEDRVLVHEAIIKIAKKMGYRVETGADQHSGRTYKMVYTSDASGQRDFVKVDMDYLNRAPLLPLEFMEPTWGKSSGIKVPVNAPLELAAGKLKALLERVVPRDLYDIMTLAKNREIYSTGDEALNRKVMLFYLTLSSPFPRPLIIRDRFAGIEKEIEDNLVPVLFENEKPILAEMIDIAERFVQESVLSQNAEEEQYLAMMANAIYEPKLLFSGYPEVLEAAKVNPGMLWKLENLKRSR